MSESDHALGPQRSENFSRPQCAPALWVPARLPSELSGAYGSNRQNNPHTKSQIDAADDRAAIEKWLQLKAINPNTKRSYAKEAYRFMLWSITAQKKSISSLSVEDIQQYEAWIANPVIPGTWKKEWRIINSSGLKDSSRKQTMRILHAMFDWFCDAGYLSGNPFRLITFGNEVQRTINNDVTRGVQRFLDPEMWEWLLSFPDQLHHAAKERQEEQIANNERKRARRNLWPSERCERIRFTLVWLYRTAARRAELANGAAGDVVRNVEGNWIWWVTGKGGSESGVVLDDDAMDALARYRRSLNLPAYPTVGETGPLFYSLNGMDREPDATIYRELKAFFKEVQAYIERHEPDKEIWLPKIAKASTHWLRHTRASHLALWNAKPKTVQDQLRHSQPSTTAKYYVHVGQADRLLDIAAADKNSKPHSKALRG